MFEKKIVLWLAGGQLKLCGSTFYTSERKQNHLPCLFKYKVRFFSENCSLKVYPRLTFEVNSFDDHFDESTLLISLIENMNI